YKPYLTDDLLGQVVGTTTRGNVVRPGSTVRAIKDVDPNVAVAVLSDATGNLTVSTGDGNLVRVAVAGWVPCYPFNTTQLTATPLSFPLRPSWATRPPVLTFVPTSTPRPSLGTRVNPTQFYHLADAKDTTIKGAVRGGFIQDQTLQRRLIASLDVDIP